MQFRSALLASAVMAMPLAAANAQAVDGLYIGGGAGLNFMNREEFKATRPLPAPAASSKGDLRANLGPVVVLSLGWGFGNGLRVEAEANYRNNSFNQPRGFGGPGTAGGTEQKFGGMANVFYDFTMIPVVQPYIGAGVGMMAVSESNLHFANVGGTATPLQFGQNRDTTRSSFAYQGIVGAALPLGNGFAVTAEYRFLGLAGERRYSAVVGGGNGSVTSTDNYNHSFLVGFRYAFGAAPVAAAPMPTADLGAKTFLVFFDWDRADLTARSQGIIREAAANSSRTQNTRIDVDGNADTSGNPGYNIGLSERRARAVAAELVRNGVPQNAISIHAFGDTKLLVPTGPGVREPQNRRVEIVYR